METVKTRYQCRHIFTAGRRCQSPSLRGQDLKAVAEPQTRVPHPFRSLTANRVGYRLRKQTTVLQNTRPNSEPTTLPTVQAVAEPRHSERRNAQSHRASRSRRLVLSEAEGIPKKPKTHDLSNLLATDAFAIVASSTSSTSATNPPHPAESQWHTRPQRLRSTAGRPRYVPAVPHPSKAPSNSPTPAP